MFVPTFEELCGPEITGLCFAGEDFHRMRQPCVYVWVRSNQVMYVGRSNHGVARAFSVKHHVLARETFGPRDALHVYHPVKPERLVDLEELLIRSFRPLLNQVMPRAQDRQIALNLGLRFVTIVRQRKKSRTRNRDGQHVLPFK